MKLFFAVVALTAFFASSSASTTPSLALYYESLCPGCHDFLTTQLAPTFQKLEGLIDVVLVPYGNARLVNGTIQCQHGPEECYGNLVQACQLASKGTTTRQSLTYITCMIEQPNSEDTHATAETCAKELSLDWDSLSACASGPEGAKLIAANKAKTDALKPAHQYVPWVTINGVHTEVMNDKCLSNLLAYLCANYLVKAPECKTVSQLPAVGHRDKCFNNRV